jgi:hypothetical protein
MRTYQVKIRFNFTGTFFINAATEAEAKEYVERHCGLVLGGGIHSTLPGNTVDWEFPRHPEKTLLGIKPGGAP